MAETKDNRVCENCRAVVRPRALFCFHCGAPVAKQKTTSAKGNKKEISDAWFKDSLIEKKDSAEEKEPMELTEASPEETPIVRQSEPKVRQSEPIKEKKTLKSAASIRQKSKTVSKQVVELTWEKPESSSNMLFFLATIVLLMLVAGVLIGAMLIR